MGWGNYPGLVEVVLIGSKQAFKPYGIISWVINEKKYSSFS